jgi:hypothetical protein
MRQTRTWHFYFYFIFLFFYFLQFGFMGLQCGDRPKSSSSGRGEEGPKKTYLKNIYINNK